MWLNCSLNLQGVDYATISSMDHATCVLCRMFVGTTEGLVMSKAPHDPRGFDVVTLQPKAQEDSFGVILARTTFNIACFASVPASLLKNNKYNSQQIRSILAKLIYVVLRTKRQQPDEFIKFVNEFRRLDKEYQEELMLEQQHK